jgi:FHS family L-fucose permease-like MFS transporter
MRINISQAFNGVGTVVAPVLGSYVFFLKTADDTQALRNVQWVYLASCHSLLLVSVSHSRSIYSSNTDLKSFSSTIPEITDADMAFQAAETHADTDIGPFHKQYRLFHAAFAQFCYTGAQVRMNLLLSPALR